MSHIPVLLKEVIEYLNPGPGKKYIDATIGMAGHAVEIVKRGGTVLGIDQDSTLIPERSVAESKGPSTSSGIKLVAGNFKDIKNIAEENGFTEVDGILFDLGMGSHQLDDPERGFSFQKEGPLDMRYERSDPSRPSGTLLKDGEGKGRGRTAADVVNKYPEKELVRIFYQYGEERRFGKKVARAIVERRKTNALKTTTELFELTKHGLPAKLRFKSGDVARRIFQALRIEVNQELDSLEKALPQALDLLKGGGVLAVISFHSLEDRIVKNFLRDQARDCVCPPEFPVCRCDALAKLRILTKKPITASAEETEINPRSKSAKLRAAEKIWADISHLA